jgi:cytochrome c-type biogenesis protein CcmH
VCQNESIDESNASLARDLRLLVRERLVLGESNEEVLDFVVTRYGEFALLRPQTKGSNVILWVAGPVMLLLALLIAFAYIRSRQAQVNGAASNALSVDEKERLDKILERTNLE